MVGMWCISSVVQLIWVAIIWSSGGGAAAEDPQPVNYENYTLFRVSSTQSPFTIEEGFYDSVITSHPNVQSPAYELVVPPKHRLNFIRAADSRKWNYEVIHPNVQELIDRESEGSARAGEEVYGWDRYHSYEETNEWMASLAERFPGQVTLFHLGKSYQNRETTGVRLSRRANNPAVVIESGVHSREWIGPATSTFIFNELLTSSDPEIRRLSQEYDWYVVPMVNPDGYTFTRYNRMWRKNMRLGFPCMGVDLNRNFDYHWREAGASSFTCSDRYAGPAAMSEPETKNLDEFMGTISEQVKLYISFHSYSQLLLWPEGHTKTRIPEFDDYELIGKATVEAIAVRYGTEYQRGSIIEAIYPASGSTIDYMRSKYHIPLAFCFELRPKRDQGVGFILSPSEITPTGEETLDGIGAMIREGQRLGYFDLKK